MDEAENQKEKEKVGNKPPKPDPETDPVGVLRWELMYQVPAFARMSSKDIELHCERFREKLEREKANAG